MDINTKITKSIDETHKNAKNKVLYTTSEKLKTTKLEDGSFKNTYALTAFVTSDLTFYYEAWDDKIAIRALYNHKYNNVNGNIYDLYDISQVSGQVVQRDDSKIQLKSLEIWIQNLGRVYLNGNTNSGLGTKSFSDKNIINYPNVGKYRVEIIQM